MRAALARALLLGPLALAGCAANEPAQQVEALQAAVPSVIDCDRLAATRPVAVDASAVAGPDRPGVPVGVEIQVRLQELRAVTSLIGPGRLAKTGDRFAGHLPIRVDTNGTYTILVASLAWADLAEENPARLVEPHGFKWVTVCGRRYKSGLYTLERRRSHYLQLWDSPDRELALMIHRVR